MAKGTGQETPRCITPYFTVDDADRLQAFLIAAFWAITDKEDRYPDGRIQHARLRIGDSLIMMNQASESYAANVSQLRLYVDDLDTVHQQALWQGAVSIMAPNIRPHWDRMEGITDPCGNIWWIAERGP